MSKKSTLYVKPDNTGDYIKTFFTTLFIVLMFGIFNICYMIYGIFNNDTNPKKQNIDSTFEAYLVDILIDKNKEIAARNPKNYAVNMRLGILYSYKRDYLNAEKEFKNSIEKAVAYDYTPSYQLAKLYVKTDRLKEAQEEMDKIGDKPIKRLLRFKGDIYNLLGDSYYNQGYYALSVIKYEKAMKYYDAIQEKLLNSAKENYVKAYTALGDKYVEVGKIDEAIMSLNNAYELKPKDVNLNYKLGLLHVNKNPELAQNYLAYVQKKNPQALNYDLYFDLLNKLADIETQKGNVTNGELYRKKALQYQKFVKNNLLYEKDLFIDVFKTEIKIDLAAKEYIATLQFNLQNNSGLDIENLTVQAIFKDNGNVIQNFNQKIFDEVKTFKAGQVTTPIVVSASEPYKNNQSGSITVDIYAYKYPKYIVKLYSTSIPKPPVTE